MAHERSRRDFLFTSSTLLSAAWLSAHVRELEAVSATARRAFEAQQPFRNLTAAEARTLAAFSEQILPSGDLPGAREAGAVYFMDTAVGGFAKPLRPLIGNAVKALDGAARKRKRQATLFADLSSRQQIAVLRDFQSQPEFGLLRTLTVLAVFSDPKYGGNRNQTAFKLLDVQHRPAYAPPFGYYDAQLAQSVKARQP